MKWNWNKIVGYVVIIGLFGFIFGVIIGMFLKNEVIFFAGLISAGISVFVPVAKAIHNTI